MCTDILQRTEHRKEKKLRPGSTELIYSPRVYEEILTFLKTALKVSATFHEKETKDYVSELFNNEDKKQSITDYVKLMTDALGPSGGKADLHHLAASSLLDLLSYQPSQIGSYLTPKPDLLRQYLFVGAYESRELVARIIGLLATELDFKTVLLPIVNELLANISSGFDTGIEKQYGSIEGLGFILSRCLQAKVNVPKDIVVDAIFHIFQFIGML
jgi:hypothetical protein